jgi:TolA-binding protein
VRLVRVIRSAYMQVSDMYVSKRGTRVNDNNNTLAQDLREEIREKDRQIENIERRYMDLGETAVKQKDRIASLEAELARCRAANVYDAEAHRRAAMVGQLEAALAHQQAESIFNKDIKIVDSAPETATEPVMPKYYATCCKCKKVIAVDAPPQGIFYCGYGCT